MSERKEPRVEPEDVNVPESAKKAGLHRSQKNLNIVEQQNSSSKEKSITNEDGKSTTEKQRKCVKLHRSKQRESNKAPYE